MSIKICFTSAEQTYLKKFRNDIGKGNRPVIILSDNLPRLALTMGIILAMS